MINIIIATFFLGFIIRLSWAKYLMKGKLYRVPAIAYTPVLILVGLIMPTSLAIFSGIFLVDILASIAIRNSVLYTKFKSVLQKIIDLMPLNNSDKDIFEESSNDKDTKSNNSSSIWG